MCLSIFCSIDMLFTPSIPSSDTKEALDEKRTIQRRVQSDMTMYQSDVRRLERELQLLQVQLRDSEKKMRKITEEIKTTKEAIIKKTNSLFEANEQLRFLKKKFNTVS